ncbi:MAG: hypothetical protein ACXVB9_22425 [Bdellovibrionota bacterium]
MRTENERGGILLELIIFAFILAVFTAGAGRINAAFERRFGRILAARNEGIAAARKISPRPPAQFLPNGG